VTPCLLPEGLLEGWHVRSAKPVTGGGIAWSYRLETDDGPVFAKTIRDAPPGLFVREAAGLRALRRAGALPVPEVLRVTEEGLLLEWIESESAPPGDDAALGRGLAALHRTTGERFGSLDGDPRSFVGSVPVDLHPADSWAQSYLFGRVLPLTRRCVETGRLDPSALPLLDRVLERADEVCGPPEPPALVHGDLWSGNSMVDHAGRHWLIDPSASWSHRELDLAMMRLFGGFGPEVYTAYEEVAPLAPGWQRRQTVHQLLPLLVHVILFGTYFADEVMGGLRSLAN